VLHRINKRQLQAEVQIHIFSVSSSVAGSHPPFSYGRCSRGCCVWTPAYVTLRSPDSSGQVGSLMESAWTRTN
jgi:hypothetical protein